MSACAKDVKKADEIIDKEKDQISKELNQDNVTAD
jgi:hypothetical protein